MPGQRASEAQRKREIREAAYQVAVQKGLDGLTGRDVAQAAGLSSGLVFFHYGSKEALRLALLDELIDWLVGSGQDVPALEPVADLLAAIQAEIGLQQADHEKVGLFLQYWVLGMRFPEVRARLRQALDDYRALFHEPARELLIARGSEPQEEAVASLAALGVSIVVGCAFQELLDPGWFARERPLAGAGWLAALSPSAAAAGDATARSADT
ncbi:MAG: TetR/AcrR family transcriptional regulator [Chloroflexi bacterium]|nr:TetR/AcrR family transcriptional regulator [Chloroflexota bacterium]